MNKLLYFLAPFVLIFTGCDAENTSATRLELSVSDRQISQANFGRLYVGVQVNDGNIVTEYLDRRDNRTIELLLPSNRRSVLTLYWLEEYIDEGGEKSLLYLSKQVQQINVGSELDNFLINARHDDTGTMPSTELGLDLLGYRYACDPLFLTSDTINPCSADADRDGVSSLAERKMGTDPLKVESTTPVRGETSVAPNLAPVILSTPRSAAMVGIEYRYQVVANDVNEDVLTYSLSGAPRSMSIDGTGLIRWLPASIAPRIFTEEDVVLEVSDQTESTLQGFRIVVTGEESVLLRENFEVNWDQLNERINLRTFDSSNRSVLNGRFIDDLELEQFAVVRGSVDLFQGDEEGRATFGLRCSTDGGSCLDLDGHSIGSDPASELLSRPIYFAKTGFYEVTFSVSGNTANGFLVSPSNSGSETLRVSISGIGSNEERTIMLPMTRGLVRETLSFYTYADQIGMIKLETFGPSDSAGPILDDVEVRYCGSGC